MIDHINGNTLDNQRHNLRACSNKENMRNRGMASHNSSGFKGVSWLEGKWSAYIGENGKKIHLGLFKTREDAARRYNKEALKRFGEFAKLNKGV
jgi:hypothetical protein